MSQITNWTQKYCYKKRIIIKDFFAANWPGRRKVVRLSFITPVCIFSCYRTTDDEGFSRKDTVCTYSFYVFIKNEYKFTQMRGIRNVKISAVTSVCSDLNFPLHYLVSPFGTFGFACPKGKRCNLNPAD